MSENAEPMFTVPNKAICRRETAARINAILAEDGIRPSEAAENAGFTRESDIYRILDCSRLALNKVKQLAKGLKVSTMRLYPPAQRCGDNTILASELRLHRNVFGFRLTLCCTDSDVEVLAEAVDAKNLLRKGRDQKRRKKVYDTVMGIINRDYGTSFNLLARSTADATYRNIISDYVTSRGRCLHIKCSGKDISNLMNAMEAQKVRQPCRDQSNHRIVHDIITRRLILDYFTGEGVKKEWNKALG